MRGPGRSIDKVAYDLRPCKQTERMMIIHLLQNMAETGFKISEYQYTGFGSLFFIDFVLLRKMLGIYDMASAEIRQDFESRVRFNSPYSDIRIHMGDVGHLIPKLSLDKKHLLWLDYDDVIQEYMVSHIVDALTLPPGSIIVVTIDIDFDSLENSSNKAWFEHLTAEVEDYVAPGFSPNDCGSLELAETTISILVNVITRAMSGREEVSFEPLFSVTYADGHEMLTIGGIIAGRDDKRMLRACDWNRFPFSRRDFRQSPYTIKVPNLTRRERLYLDSHMPRVGDWMPKPFQLREEDLMAYCQVFKYVPLYGELLL